mmetsp:Transcript_33366/g.55854  ORF Transcript_33366/g.55854 Transcript_33366/m.55854 type:complete len:94 (+) Transcript_33366:129-410(+)
MIVVGSHCAVQKGLLFNQSLFVYMLRVVHKRLLTTPGGNTQSKYGKIRNKKKEGKIYAVVSMRTLQKMSRTFAGEARTICRTLDTSRSWIRSS